VNHTSLLRLSLVLVLCCTSCAVSLESSRRTLPVSFGATAEPSLHCQGLDRDRSTWAAVAAGAALLTGSSGIATIPTGDDTGRIALASTGVAGAVVGAVALAFEHSATEAWSRDCATVVASVSPAPQPPVPQPPVSAAPSSSTPSPLPPSSSNPSPATSAKGGL